MPRTLRAIVRISARVYCTGGRIGYGEIVRVQPEQWATDDNIPIQERQDRFSNFIRHFGESRLQALKRFGEQLAAAHRLPVNSRVAMAATMRGVSPYSLLWREGMEAERDHPLQHSSVATFEEALRDRLADWADFDIVATHYSYGYDLLVARKRAQVQFSKRRTSAARSV